MSYELMVEDSFDAAHALRGYKGACENLHGHSWKVQIFIIGEKLNNIGLLVDFKEIKTTLKNTLSKFDHNNLNDLPEFKEINPSCENLARIIYEKLNQSSNLASSYLVSKITVWESEKTYASYQL